MFKNYLKVAYRNILKNKGTTLINAFGMALAIGCCLYVYEFVNFFNKFDNFHSQRDNIYVVQREMEMNGELIMWNDVPQGLGTALKKDFPQVEQVVRTTHRKGNVKFGEVVFNERISFVDVAYYDLFDFPIKWGDPATFSDPNGIVLADYQAEKYFGEENPIGETLTIRFIENGEEIRANFLVKGVLAKLPSNTSFSNSMQVPFQRQEIFGSTQSDWVKLSNPTFIQVKEATAIADILSAEQQYISPINKANEHWNMVHLHLEPLTGIIFTAFHVRNNVFDWTHRIAITMVSLIGIFLLLMACFNYLNITLAAAATRLKEISVRKVMGGTRRQIIQQFLLENLLICGGAFVLGIVLAQTLFFPWMNDVVMKGLDLQLTYLSDPTIWLFTIALLLLIIIGSAGYPALYISKYQPVAILKKEFRLGGSKNRFQKILVGGQLFLSFLTLFTTIAALLSHQSVQEKDWGYNQNDIVVIDLEDGKDFQSFKNELQQYPDILEIAGSQQTIGKELQDLEVNITGETYQVKGITVAANYFNTLQIPLIAGRFFKKEQTTDQVQSVLVNEAFKQVMNWEQAVGKRISLANQSYQIIGETKNIHQNDFIRKVEPLVFKMGAEDQFSKISIRAQTGMAVSIANSLQTSWEKFYPNSPYQYYFQDNAFFTYFKIFEQGANMLSAASFLTILVCIIGIFGLAMFLLSRKMKEISVRKVLGASHFQIAHLVQKDFLIPLVVALVLALPVGYGIISGMRDEFTPEMPISILPFVLTIFSILLIVLFSLSKHIHTAIRSEPSQFLRDE